MDINKLSTKDFKPLWDNIMVKPVKLEKKGNWVLSRQEEDKAEIGEITSVPDALEEDFSIGDIVLFNKYSTTQIELGEELIVRAEDIVAIVKNK